MPLRPAAPLNSENMFSAEHLSKGTTSFLTALFGDPEEALGNSFAKIKAPSTEISPLRLEHASKEAKPKPPSSTHLREIDKDRQEALQSNDNAPGSRQAIHTRQ